MSEPATWEAVEAPWPPARVPALIVCAALAGCAGLSPAPPAARLSTMAAKSDYNLGAEAFAAGYYGKAAQAFYNAVAEAPASIEALNGLAAAYDHLGRYDLAARYYSRAMTVDPASPQTLNNIGYSYMLQGKFDLAAVFLRDAQAIAPGDPAIVANLAIAEAALRASRPTPSAQWPMPSNQESRPAPHTRIERRSPILQTLSIQPAPTRGAGVVPARLPASMVSVAAAPPAGRDSLPGPLAAPIGDTRLAAVDRLPRPIAAGMTDVWAGALQASASGGNGHD